MNTAVEFGVVAGYLIFLVAIGWLFRRLNSNASDYFRAGCRGAWWLVGMSMLMSSISVATFTANAGVAFDGGWSVSLIYLINAGCYLVNFLFLAAWFRQIRVVTFPDAIRLRFGPHLEQVYAYYNSVTLLLFAGLQLYSLAVFANALFGLPILLTIPAIGVVLMFYSVTGGSWAVMATDFVQGLIMIPLTIVLTVYCLAQFGGVGGFFDAIDQQNLGDTFKPVKSFGDEAAPNDKFTIAWFAGLALIQISANLGMINSVRFFAAKTGRDARKGAGLVMVLMLVGAAFWFVPAITSRLLYSEQVLAVDIANPSESAFAIAALNLLPAGLIGLMMVAMFSASMSSLDSALNWNAGIFVRNVFPPLVRLTGRPEPAEDDPRLLKLGRLFTILFGVVMILVAIYFRQSGGQGVFETGFAINAAFALPMMVPLLLALFVRRVPGWAGLASLLCGLSVSAVTFAFGIEIETHWVSILAASAAALGFFATMPFWKLAPRKDHERTRAFFTRMHTPVDFEAEVGEANDHVQLNMIGFFTAGMALFVALLLLVPNDLVGRLAIASIALFLGVIGGVMLLAARRRRSALTAFATETPA